jgi:hypothetical protein
MGITITELSVMIPASVDTPYRMQKFPQLSSPLSGSLEGTGRADVDRADAGGAHALFGIRGSIIGRKIFC